MTWVSLALLSAIGAALTALALQAAVHHGGALRSTVGAVLVALFG